MATPLMAARAGVSGPDIDGFRTVQRLAYDCAEAVAAQLRPGVTERQAAAMMRRWLADRGVHDWLHLPFAWFGDRTAFTGFKVPHQFFPTGRRLTEGMPFILDAAPIYQGYTADIGYTSSLGPNRVLDHLLDDLAVHRALIVEAVRAGRTLRQIYLDVDELMARQGYENRHRAYPFGVIAHRVGKISDGTVRPHAFGFGSRALLGLLQDGVRGHREGWSPLWNPRKSSDHPATPGLWAVEPHLGFRGVGAKFEELLVVQEDGDAYWLDDTLPHLRRWAGRGISGSLATGSAPDADPPGETAARAVVATAEAIAKEAV
ncbi:M24 family metallopeptidase [Yinghuangia seranimata]|uniref:M24 family metallopeptidase n=1 Tax=Yinghuangia seranimata TaxID=408067 RepID=UPI00248B8573|nr:M24 family metallopeptidase [Yinghuangia seranimata]MDI2124532.1 M24 family metallopeptidase [Yinghuangia seranimata]